MKHSERNENIIKFIPWIRKTALNTFHRYDSGFCEAEDVVNEGIVYAIEDADKEERYPFSFFFVRDKMKDFMRMPLRRKSTSSCVPYDDSVGKNQHETQFLSLKQAIKQLEREEKIIIILFYYGKKTEEEIGKIVKKHRITVGKIRRKSLRRLHEILS